MFRPRVFPLAKFAFKCDERKPVCQHCTLRSIQCTYPPPKSSSPVPDRGSRAPNGQITNSECRRPRSRRPSSRRPWPRPLHLRFHRVIPLQVNNGVYVTSSYYISTRHQLVKPSATCQPGGMCGSTLSPRSLSRTSSFSMGSLALPPYISHGYRQKGKTASGLVHRHITEFLCQCLGRPSRASILKITMLALHSGYLSRLRMGINRTNEQSLLWEPETIYRSQQY